MEIDCYFCSKHCHEHSVYWRGDYFCSTECVSSYQTFEDMLDFFKERKEYGTHNNRHQENGKRYH